MAGQANRPFGTSELPRGQEGGWPGSSGGASPAAVAGAIKEKAQDVASSVAETAGEAWESTRHLAENAASSMATTAENAWDSMVSCMRRNPLSSFAAGVGLGVLLTMAFRNTRS